LKLDNQAEKKKRRKKEGFWRFEEMFSYFIREQVSTWKKKEKAQRKFPAPRFSPLKRYRGEMIDMRRVWVVRVTEWLGPMKMIVGRAKKRKQKAEIDKTRGKNG
jgi:hypothetical protein